MGFAHEKNEYSEEHGKSCNVHLSEEEAVSSDDYARITVKMMYFPLIFFSGFALIAILLQFIHQWRVKQHKGRSIFGSVEVSSVNEVYQKSKRNFRRRFSSDKSKKRTSDVAGL